MTPTQCHCYLVQKTHWNAVFHPAKLASGANYPVGWVQMPHSVRSEGGEGALGKGKDWGGSGECSHPGVQPPCWLCFNLRVRATAFPHLDLLSLFSVPRRECSFAASFEPGGTAVVHWWPMSNLSRKNKRLRLNMDANKTHLCVFAWWLRQWLFGIFNWKGDMAPHGNPSVQKLISERQLPSHLHRRASVRFSSPISFISGNWNVRHACGSITTEGTNKQTGGYK